MGGDRDRYTALVGGVVDAAVVSNEYLPLASSKNLKMLLEGKDALPNFLRVCMFSSGKALAERREDAIRYLTAQSKALRYALAHRDEIIKLTAEATDAKPDDPRPAFVFDEAVKVGAIAPDLPLPMDKLAWMQQEMVELGQIPRRAISPRWSTATFVQRWSAQANEQHRRTRTTTEQRNARRCRGVRCLLAAFAGSRGAGARFQALAAGDDHPQGRCGLFPDGGETRFRGARGLKVDVLEVKDDPIGMKALLSGEVDSYEGVYGAIAASARGADVKLLGCNWHAAPYVMLARPGIGSIEELRGKSIAASSPGTPPDMVARAALVAAKLPPRPGEARSGRRRPRSFHRAARRGGRRRGRVQRIRRCRR